MCGKRCIPQKHNCGETSSVKVHPLTAQNLSRIEDEIRDEKIEYVSAIDPKTGKEMFRYSGDSTSVDIPEKEFPRLRGKILTHNHPNVGNWPPSDPRSKGFSFSPADIHTSSALGVKEVRAVSSGYDHSMIMPKEPIDVAKVVTKHSGKIYRGVQADLFWGRIDWRSADVEFWHRLWTEVAKETPGMVYTRTEIAKKKDSFFDLAARSRTIVRRRSVAKRSLPGP